MTTSLQRWRLWLKNRPDREHEITLNRVVISLGIFIYVWLIMPGGSTRPPRPGSSR